MARILVVDDEDVVRVVIDDILSRDGHEVVAVEDGREAMDVMRRELPTLVIVDLLMPRMNGFDFIRTALEEFPDTPIVAMSGGGGRYEAKGLLGVAEFGGAVAVLVKPFTPDRLRIAIESVHPESPLERSRAPAR